MIVCHDLIQRRNVFIEFIGEVQEESTRICVVLLSCYSGKCPAPIFSNFVFKTGRNNYVFLMRPTSIKRLDVCHLKEQNNSY